MGVLRLVVCASLTGFAIKSMDDYLDVSEDAISSRPNLAATFGRALIPYAMLLLAVAAMVDWVTALSLFAAAYAVGMIRDQGQVYPLGTTPAFESVGVVAVSAWLIGIRPVACSVAVMSLIQVIDDIVDRCECDELDRGNLVLRYGFPECIAAAVVLCTAAAFLDLKLLLVCLFSAGLLEVALRLWHRPGAHSQSWS